MVIANTVAATMYVLHQGFHLPVYLGSEYYTTVVAGQEITRTFTFMPQFSLLALAFVLARRQWDLKWLVVLGITLLAIMVSYTRALLIAAVVGIVVAVLVREFSRPDAGRLRASRCSRSRSASSWSPSGSASCDPSSSRISSAASATSPRRTAPATSRTGRSAEASSMRCRSSSPKQDLWLGLGYPEAGSNPIEPFLYLWSSDSTWVPIVYAFGLLGLVLFAALLVGVRRGGPCACLCEPPRSDGIWG